MAKKSNSGGILVVFIIIIALIIGGILIASEPSNSSSSSTKTADQTQTVQEIPTLINRDDAPTFGAKDATVKIVVFSDFLCPYCISLHNKINAILDANKSAVSETIRTFKTHSPTDIMPKAFEAANLQGKAREASDALFSGTYKATDEDMSKMATAIGLDIAKFQTDKDSPAVAAKLAKDNQDATSLGLGGTPSAYINGKYIDDIGTIESQINQLLGK